MNEALFNCSLETPVGFLNLSTDNEKLYTVSFSATPVTSSKYVPAVIQQCVSQLEEYFDGSRKEFDLKLNLAGTTFQKKVWEYIQNIPFGETATYIEVAEALGSKKLTRAVGLANSKNPIPIIIPCHRIIGSSGKLTGYAGGIERKKWLLQHELKYSTPKNRLF